MWPSYYGMTAENLLARHEEPNPVTQVARLLAFGAIRHEVLAPDNGEVSAMFFRNEPHTMAYKVVKGRKWLVFPTDLKEYTFYVNGKEATVRVPVDFSETEFDELVHDTFFGGNEGFLKAIAAAEAAHTLERGRLQHKGATYSVDLFRFGKTVKQGEPLMRFDILSGDMLFVDRISYHFVKPSVGDGFVFHTRKIELLDNADQYYIKRLVGLPGDTIEIREPVVYRNGAPITGAKAFELNAHRVSPYRGYADASRWGWPNLRKGEPLKVPDNHFFALGDNSYNSLDGRYWGFIPAKEAIGRPLFIFYPLTKRWGRSH
jgi:signal peptidase I